MDASTSNHSISVIIIRYFSFLRNFFACLFLTTRWLAVTASRVLYPNVSLYSKVQIVSVASVNIEAADVYSEPFWCCS